MAGTTEGRRERKKQATSMALYDAAVRLFAEKGFADTTVEEIAEAADVATRTFFRHFGSKEAVLFGDEEERRELWIEAMRARPSTEPVFASVREACLALAADYSPAKDFVLRDLAVNNRSIGAHWLQIGASWERVMADEVATRLGADSRFDVRARIVAATAMGAWRVAETNWVHDKGARALRTHVIEAYDALDTVVLATAAGTATGSDADVVDVRDKASPTKRDSKASPRNTVKETR